MSQNETRIVPCPHCFSLNRIPLEVGAGGKASCGKCKGALDASWVFEVTTAGLRKIVLNAPIPVVVDFWAPWCGPCVGFAPTFQKYASQNPTQALFLKINTEAHQDSGSIFNIRSIPTLILFQNEKEKTRLSGALPLPMLAKWVQANISNS